MEGGTSSGGMKTRARGAPQGHRKEQVVEDVRIGNRVSLMLGYP
jgi:hypothetical protein